MKKKEKICLVDGTWQGRMAIELKYFLEDNFHGDFEVYCAIFGITAVSYTHLTLPTT